MVLQQASIILGSILPIQSPINYVPQVDSEAVPIALQILINPQLVQQQLMASMTARLTRAGPPMIYTEMKVRPLAQ